MSRQQPSTVWNYFTRSDDRSKATCNVCQAVLICRNYGTSSLTYHLKHKHATAEHKEDKTGPSQAKRRKTLPFVVKPKITEEELYAELVAYDNIPPFVCARSSFIRSSMKLKGFKEVTAAAVVEKVKSFDEEVRKQLKDKFAKLIENGQRMSITIDEYTSSNNNRHLTVTVHYNVEDYDNLGMVRMFGSQTSETLKDLTEKKLNEFGLDWNHIVACTTDGTSVMKRMGKLMLPLHGICLSHAIHLAVCDVLYEKRLSSEVQNDQDETAVGISNKSVSDTEMNEWVNVVDPNDTEIATTIVLKKEIDKAVAKVRKIVQKIRKNSVKSDFLKAKCVESGAKFTNLILDCRTSWNSLADMLDRYIKLQNVVKGVLEEYDYPKEHQLTRRETDVVQQVSEALQMVKVAASYLSSRNINLMIADTIMKETIFTLNERNTAFTSQLAESLQRRYSERKLKKTLQLMYYLDGRKNQVKSSDLELQRYATMIWTRLFGAPSQCSSSSQIVGDDKDRNDESDCKVLEDVNAVSFAEKLNKRLNKCRSTQSAFAQPVSKSQAPCFEEFKLFAKTGEKTENLKKLEAALNTIQISSVESERAFSAAGLFLTKLRCRMSDATFDRHCFLKAYFKNKKKIVGT